VRADRVVVVGHKGIDLGLGQLGVGVGSVRADRIVVVGDKGIDLGLGELGVGGV
jgi:hypothetical protein